MDIPLEVVAILGFGASLKYAYKVFSKGDYKNIGALISTLYLTFVYIALSIPNFTLHGSPLVRLGVTIVFVDKIIVFSYNLFQELAKKRLNCKCTELEAIKNKLVSLIRGKNENADKRA